MVNFKPVSCVRNNMEVANRVHSWIFWNYVFHKQIEGLEWIPDEFLPFGYTFPGNSIDWKKACREIDRDYDCFICENRRTRNDEFGYYYCMCELLERSFRFKSEIGDLKVGSTFAAHTLSDFKIWGETQRDRDALSYNFGEFKKWYIEPTRWLLLSGPPGCGKSLLMSIAMTKWRHLAIYIEAGKLEDLIFRGLSENNLVSLINVLKYAPMLFIDDMGIEYSSPIVKNQFVKLIQHRSKEEIRQDAVTVFASNLTPKELSLKLATDGILRIGSRLSDPDTLIISFNPATPSINGFAKNDYRYYGRDHGNT